MSEFAGAMTLTLTPTTDIPRRIRLTPTDHPDATHHCVESTFRDGKWRFGGEEFVTAELSGTAREPQTDGRAIRGP